MKKFMKRVSRGLLGGLIGFVLWPVSIFAAIPLLVKFIYRETESKALAAFVGIPVGLLLVCLLVLGGGVALPYFLGKLFYLDEKERQENVEIATVQNQAFLTFLENYKKKSNVVTLSDTQIKQFETIIENTQDVALKAEYIKLLNRVSGEEGRTSILLEEYYSVEQPITLKQTMINAKGEITENYGLYSCDELLAHVKRCTVNGEITFNPIVRNHELVLDENHHCTFQGKDEDVGKTYHYQLLYGFPQHLRNAFITITEIIKAKLHIATSSTALIQDKLPAIEKVAAVAAPVVVKAEEAVVTAPKRSKSANDAVDIQVEEVAGTGLRRSCN